MIKQKEKGMTLPRKTILYRILAAAFALCLWQGAALLVNADYILASPVQVAVRLSALLFEPDFFATVLFSFLRISGGFLGAFVLGTLCAVGAGRFSALEYLLWPFVITVKSVPIASFIILFLLWMNYGQFTVFIAMLIAFPVIYSNVLQGIKSTSKKLTEVADLYCVPFARRLHYIYLPAIKPFLISACNVAVGMVWKAGVAAEVIGVVNGSVGGKLYDAKVYFQNADLLAWTVVIIAVSILSEKCLTLLLKQFFKAVEKH